MQMMQHGTAQVTENKPVHSFENPFGFCGHDLVKISLMSHGSEGACQFSRWNFPTASRILAAPER
jgi:hypothetical protein